VGRAEREKSIPKATCVKANRILDASLGDLRSHTASDQGRGSAFLRPKKTVVHPLRMDVPQRSSLVFR
jgi:hypothetical protein